MIIPPNQPRKHPSTENYSMNPEEFHVVKMPKFISNIRIKTPQRLFFRAAVFVFYEMVSTLMVLVLPDFPLMGPPVRTTLSPGFSPSAFLALAMA